MPENQHEVMKISDILYSYPEPAQRFPRANGCCVHVLKGPDKTVMIDTGDADGFPTRLAEAMAVDGLSFRDINEIWITHPHGDHVGGIPAVRAASGCGVVIHPGGAADFRGPGHALKQLVNECGADSKYLFNVNPMLLKAGARLAWDRYSVPKWVSTFTDGEVRDIGFPVEVKFVPGHLPESVVFFVPSEGILFTGDAFDVSRHVRPTINNPLSDWADLHATLEWMLAKNPEILANGHHQVVTGQDQCREAIETSLGFLDKERAAVLEVLASGPAGLDDFLDHYDLKDQEARGPGGEEHVLVHAQIAGPGRGSRTLPRDER